jgi:hypothetical protein
MPCSSVNAGRGAGAAAPTLEAWTGSSCGRARALAQQDVRLLQPRLHGCQIAQQVQP